MLFIILTSCTKEEENNKYVFVGDSLVRNWDVESFFPYLYTENLGVDGYRIEDCRNLNVNVPEDCIILLVGTNNLPTKVNDTYISDFTEEYCSLIETMKYKKLFCISILPKDNYNNSNIITLNNVLKEEIKCMNNVEFIDVFSSFSFNGGINPEYTIDGIHLSYKGYEVLTDKVSNVICH